MYFVIDMGLDKDGNGPETDPEKVVQTVWEIWDQEFNRIAQYTSQEEADHECVELNQYIYDKI